MEVNRPALRTEEIVGLGLAALAHVGLVAVLLIQATDDVDTIPPPERMAVSLTDGTELANLSPNPGDERLAPGAPELASIDNFVPPTPTPDEQSEQPVVDPQASSLAPNSAKPKPKSSSKPNNKPKDKKSDPKKKDTGKKPGGGSSSSKDKDGEKGTGFGGAFGGGFGDTAAAKKNIKVSISSQVLPKWNSCRISGLDVDKLRAKVSFRMDASGRISNIGTPRVTGKTPSNSAQAGRFGECAVRALKLVKRFSGLPSDRHDLFSSYEFTFRKE